MGIFPGPAVREGPLPKDRIKMLAATDHNDELGHIADEEDCEITLEHVGNVLVELILPHFKGSIVDGNATLPQFRKSLTSEEVNTILVTLHDMLTQIKLRERHEINEAKQRHPTSFAS